jgi:hypothetical protein
MHAGLMRPMRSMRRMGAMAPGVCEARDNMMTAARRLGSRVHDRGFDTP